MKCRKFLGRLYMIFGFFGFNPLIFLISIIRTPSYIIDIFKYDKQRGKNNDFKFGFFYPVLGDKYLESGTMSGHYFHQDLFIARKIYEANPIRHLDIGSRTDGFVAHIAVFREIEIMDIRDQDSKAKNIIFNRADLTKLPEKLIESFDSISSLHAIEHFGLGRYGDSINYNGHILAIKNIGKMLKKNGIFYFSVPIGKQRVEFNAHRVFSIKYLLNLFKDEFILESFSYVDDKGDFFEDVSLDKNQINKNYGCNYGCGIFILKKK